ncbi:ABC transporter substrate-binding protein [Gilvimarinus sp. 1_MG-2023]|uniref:ABC transporter substrate-binding protein n=1 Tax=Gilvimarinus sp. 1_MG-2023 TaxID=3062638 RepID=UPI0026E298A8|nr:ABC transporter substrate-binding protein [Gilvimarinus sp. 1_MG-2023]MDO6746527.1 ABC transporter substrate-binding protein [Gilvimarinus sp. 1_MG-2023]
MKKKLQVKIGIIASKSGANAKAGRGMLDSAQYMIDRKAGWLEKKGIFLELVVKDDSSLASTAVEKAKELVAEDCLVIIGPTDSLAMREILESEVCSNIAVFSTISSATFLSNNGHKNFFRFTTPDSIRAEILVRYVKRIYPGSLVYVAAQEGHELSYGQQLKKDVINSLEKYSVKWTHFDFNNDSEPKGMPSENEPTIACGPSASVKELAKIYRDRGIRSQFFAFGSNTNLLDDVLINTIVVCDLDREDVNPIARDEIDHFQAIFRDTADPDLSTMNAVVTFCNVLYENQDSVLVPELPARRYQLLNTLNSGVHKALLGSISFSDTGEMAGYENISVLKVSKLKGKYYFSQIDREEKPLLQDSKWWKNNMVLAISIIGSIASIGSLVYAFF